MQERATLAPRCVMPINRVIGINPSPYQRCSADYYLDQLSRTRRCYAHKYESQDAFLPLSLQQAFHEELSPAQEWCKFGFRHSAHPCYHEYSLPCVYPLFELYAPYGYLGFRLQNNLMVIKKASSKRYPLPRCCIEHVRIELPPYYYSARSTSEISLGLTCWRISAVKAPCPVIALALPSHRSSALPGDLVIGRDVYP